MSILRGKNTRPGKAFLITVKNLNATANSMRFGMRSMINVRFGIRSMIKFGGVKNLKYPLRERKYSWRVPRRTSGITASRRGGEKMRSTLLSGRSEGRLPALATRSNRKFYPKQLSLLEFAHKCADYIRERPLFAAPEAAYLRDQRGPHDPKKNKGVAGAEEAAKKKALRKFKGRATGLGFSLEIRTGGK